MKQLFILLISAVLLVGCTTSYKCYPSKKSRDYAVPVRIWSKPASDGYWNVYVTKGMEPTRVFRFECCPDTVDVEKLWKEYPRI